MIKIIDSLILVWYPCAIMKKTYKNPRTQIGHELSELNVIYHAQIPLNRIFEIIKESGGLAVDESGQEWSGFLCGESGHCTIDITGIKTSGLSLSWYKMPSGNYEITCYLM
jgi:hypothetical protein